MELEEVRDRLPAISSQTCTGSGFGTDGNEVMMVVLSPSYGVGGRRESIGGGGNTRRGDKGARGWSRLRCHVVVVFVERAKQAQDGPTNGGQQGERARGEWNTERTSVDPPAGSLDIINSKLRWYLILTPPPPM